MGISDVPSVFPRGLLRTLPCPQAGPGILSSPQTWPCLSYQVRSLSETQMSESEDWPRALIPHRDLPGPKVGAVASGVPSDWGPGSPESSVSVLPLASWRTCTLPSAHVRSHPLSQVPSCSETLMWKSGHPVKCASCHQGGPGLAAETWNCGLTSVLSLGPHPEPWQVLRCRSPWQRPDTHQELHCPEAPGGGCGHYIRAPSPGLLSG